MYILGRTSFAPAVSAKEALTMRLIEDVVAVVLLVLLPDVVLERFCIYKSLETIIGRRAE